VTLKQSKASQKAAESQIMKAIGALTTFFINLALVMIPNDIGKVYFSFGLLNFINKTQI